MPTPAEILERNAQQAKAAQAGGGKAHEGGGLLADADFEVSDDSEMVKESNAFWLEKFSLKICGKNLSANATRKLLIAGAALLCVMVLVTIVAVTGSPDGAPPLTPKAQKILRSGVNLPVEFVVQADSIPDDDDDVATWDQGFERDLVSAINDEQQGLHSLADTQWATELVLHDSQVAVGTIEDADPTHLPCQGPEVEARKVTVYFLIQTVSDSAAILRVLDKQRPTKSSWCNSDIALKRGAQSTGILDINVDVEMLEDDHVQVRREGAGPCVRSGRSNCGDHADCIDTEHGHECVCRSGYKRGEGVTSCVAQSGDSIAGNINEARRSGDYVRTAKVQTATSCDSSACGGTTTWRLQITLLTGARNVYALFGQDDHPLDLPPAYQVPKPFGVDIGGVNPQMLGLYQSTEHMLPFDSWVTVGETEGTVGQISTIGIDWDCWQLQDVRTCDDRGGRIHITDGAVFWMDPDAGPTGVNTRTCPDRTDRSCPIVLAQVTIRDAERGSTVRIGAQGRHDALDNWKDYPCWCLGDSECASADLGCA